MPVNLKITQYYRFVFDSKFPGQVEVKELSTSATSQTFTLMKRSREILRTDVDFIEKQNKPAYWSTRPGSTWETDLSQISDLRLRSSLLSTRPEESTWRSGFWIVTIRETML